ARLTSVVTTNTITVMVLSRMLPRGRFCRERFPATNARPWPRDSVGGRRAIANPVHRNERALPHHHVRPGALPSHHRDGPLPEEIAALVPVGLTPAPAPNPPTIPRAAVAPQPAVQRQPDGCRFLLTMVTEEVCPTCQGSVRVKVYACQLHSLCTLGKALPGR